MNTMGAMSENPRKDALKRLILENLRRERRSRVWSRTELVELAMTARPDLVDDDPCYPGCDKHRTKWRHEFDRSLYDLRSTRPPKVVSGAPRGTYQLP